MFVYGDVVILKIGRHWPWKTVIVSSHLRMSVRPKLLHRMALVSFLLFRKNLGNLREFFGQMVYRPPLAKICPYADDFICNRWQNCWAVYPWVTSENYSLLREQNNSHPSPLSSIQSWSICCFLQLPCGKFRATRQLEQPHNIAWEKKLYFVLLESVKRQKCLLGKRVSTNFVAVCGFSLAV